MCHQSRTIAALCPCWKINGGQSFKHLLGKLARPLALRL
jgi:hypothetical protein